MRGLIYILSTSYSGSTLLTFLLGTHPKIASIGELKATIRGDVDKYLCSCGQRIRQCPFWQQVTQELDRRGVKFDLGGFGTHFRFTSRPLADRVLCARVRSTPFEMIRNLGLRLLPGCRRELQRILEMNRTLIEVISTIQQGDVFLDSSKEPIRLKYLLQSRCWNIKVIYLIRDGRGTANSYMKHHQTNMLEAALEWRRAHSECSRIVSRLPTGLRLTVRYEDLCQEPESSLAKIFDFVGVNPNQATRDFRSVEQHILGNYMRLDSSSELKLDEKWKTALTPEDLATFDRTAGDLNRRYGYV